MLLLGEVRLHTSRLEAMMAFYRDRIGVPLEVTQGRAEADLGGSKLVLVEDAGAGSGSAVTLLLRTARAAKEGEALRDPDGNEVRLEPPAEDLAVAGLEAVAEAVPGRPTLDPEADVADLDAWLERPEPGWSEVISPQALVAATFLSGGPEGKRLRIRYFRRESDGAMMGKVWFGPQTQGPPGHAHGGSMASLLDEAMGGAAWLAGHPVLAGELTTRFRRMLPLGTRCHVEARVAEVEGRKVTSVAHLHGLDGTLYAEGSGLFIELDRKRFGVLLERLGKFFGSDLDRTPSPPEE